jgi:hypothetical protein
MFISVCWPAWLILQGFRGFSRTDKARVLVMSYPCFRGHKAEVYKLGIDVLMCDEVRQTWLALPPTHGPVCMSLAWITMFHLKMCVTDGSAKRNQCAADA